MNLRKVWRVVKSKRPHAIIYIFLGDMMDNGFADMYIAECVYFSCRAPSLSNLQSFLFIYFPRLPARVL
jgi:hypothetical protein